jgi:TolB-like protein/Flp pilus assembly protein TadD
VVDFTSITATLRSDDDRAIAEELELVQQIAAGHRRLHQLLPIAPDTPPHLVPDRARWGHLDLLNIVGRGSFGMVYRAWDTRLERLVALKLFHGAANPAEVMQEGRMLARVRHENVVTVYGADVIDGVAGIWMELVHGQTLDFIVRRSGPLPAKEAAAVGADVARALGAVHAAGLLHCDVKAQNVVREQSGRVVLMDLGAGRLAPEMRDDSDQSTDVAGTPRYMAPELFVSGVNATKASDIYSLGVMIYFLASGKFPVEGKTLGDIRRAHEAHDVKPLSAAGPALPKAFTELVMRTIDRDPAARPAAVIEIQDALAAAAAGEPVKAPASRTGWWWWLVPAALGLALLGFVSLRPLTPASPPTESIAVMPIKNLTGDSTKDYLAEGLTEVLMAHLARVPGLHVASSGTMATLRGSTDNDRVLAEKLGVRLLLAGSVIQADDRIALSVNLTDPRAGRTIWGAELERLPSTILNARSEIASLVAARLSLVVPAAGVDTKRQLKPDAQDAFLRGVVEASTSSDVRRATAIELFTRAATLEPEWAEPLAHLAYSQQIAIQLGDPALRHDRAEKVKANALRAIQLDPGLPISYVALAAVQAYEDWDFGAAESTLRQAIAAYPRNAAAHGRLALLLAAANRLQEAEREAETARDQEPLIPERHTNLGIVRYYARGYNDALASMQEALTLSADFAPGHFGRGRVLTAVGRYDEAIQSILRAIALAPNPGYYAFLELTYTMAGRSADAQAVDARLRQLAAAGSFAAPDNRAYIDAHEGRLDAAFARLDEAVNARTGNVLWLAVDPRADPLRSDPRFDRLLARMGIAGR